MEIWGHRGARGLFPENTLEGIEGATALGIAGVEIDVALTADGVAVLSHDPALTADIARDPDGVWGGGKLIRSLRAAELARYDVGRRRPGSAAAAAFPRSAAIDGARIPRLDAALASGARCLIEMKTFPDRPDDTAGPDLMADAVLDAIVRTGAENRVCIESFDWRGLRRLRRRRPDLALAWLTRAETERNARLWWDGPAPSDYAGSVPRAVAAEGSGRGIVTWAPEFGTLTRERLEEAQALGLRVLAWTVNEPADIARLLDWGVDGVITDVPDVAAQVTGARLTEHPPPPGHPRPESSGPSPGQ